MSTAGVIGQGVLSGVGDAMQVYSLAKMFNEDKNSVTPGQPGVAAKTGMQFVAGGGLSGMGF